MFFISHAAVCVPLTQMTNHFCLAYEK